MSKLQNYANAYDRIEHEKEAEALVEAYGTQDGYLPDSYINAFNTMEKEAEVETLLSTFVPETGYIPANYVEPLRKEAALAAIGKGLTKMVGKGATSKGGKFGIKANRGRGVQGGGLKFTAFGKNMALTNKQLGGAALGAGALGVGGAGYMMGNRK